MNTRRSFFGSLIATVVAPFIPLPKATKSPRLGYRGREMFKKGIVYAPYIPVLTTKTLSDFTVSKSLMKSMSTRIQDEIDMDMINRMTIYYDTHHQ